MESWYFTFCLDHPLKNKYIKLCGTYKRTRELMFEIFGDKWGFQYSEEDFFSVPPLTNKYEEIKLGDLK